MPSAITLSFWDTSDEQGKNRAPFRDEHRLIHVGTIVDDTPSLHRRQSRLRRQQGNRNGTASHTKTTGYLAHRPSRSARPSDGVREHRNQHLQRACSCQPPFLCASLLS